MSEKILNIENITTEIIEEKLDVPEEAFYAKLLLSDGENEPVEAEFLIDLLKNFDIHGLGIVGAMNELEEGKTKVVVKRIIVRQTVETVCELVDVDQENADVDPVEFSDTQTISEKTIWERPKSV